MNLHKWPVAVFFTRQESFAISKQAMLKRKRRDRSSALASYTSLAGVPNAPANIKAMALSISDLAHSALENHPDEVIDLNTVPSMREASND